MPFSIKVYHKTKQHLASVDDYTTFGQLKDAMAQASGVAASEMKLYFRGRPRSDQETMAEVGAQPGAKVLLVECETFRQRRGSEMDAEREEAQRIAVKAEIQRKAAEEEARKRAAELEEEQARRDEKEEEVRKGLQAVADVGREVDSLANEVGEMEASVAGGQQSDQKRSRVLNELFTQKLLKLDSILGEDEIRRDRKAQIKRIEDLSKRLEGLSEKDNPKMSQAITVVNEQSAIKKVD